MLSTEFLQQLENAKPGDRLTGVIAWNVLSGSRSADELKKLLADIKKPLLKTAAKGNRVRINPLHGMPQAIVNAPIEDWRIILEVNTRLADKNDTDVVVRANERIFSTY